MARATTFFALLCVAVAGCCCFCCCGVGAAGSAAPAPFPAHRSPNTQVVYDHVKAHAQDTFKEPSGKLKFPYIVPSGPYDQLWDWDSVFTGVALLEFGSATYLAGSMKNFFEFTDATTGVVGGCLTPTGATPTLHHAKPVLIQGAWLVAKAQNDFDQFKEYESKMGALLQYWTAQRLHVDTGLYVWYDQLETGADNLVTSTCPSQYSNCWNFKDSLTLASPDVMVFLYRETLAFNRFLGMWAEASNSTEEATALRQKQQHMVALGNGIRTALNTLLWDDKKGHYIAYNTSSASSIENRVFLMALPVFQPELVLDDERLASIRDNLMQPDMMTRFGVRSTSSSDPRYTNENEIIPYSNWRGPVWVVANAMLAYGMNSFPDTEQLAHEIATNTVMTLALDLNTTHTWHECYNSETGAGLAAPGFLSWNTLGAALEENLFNHYNPFEL